MLWPFSVLYVVVISVTIIWKFCFKLALYVRPYGAKYFLFILFIPFFYLTPHFPRVWLRTRSDDHGRAGTYDHIGMLVTGCVGGVTGRTSLAPEVGMLGPLAPVIDRYITVAILVLEDRPLKPFRENQVVRKLRSQMGKISSNMLHLDPE